MRTYIQNLTMAEFKTDPYVEIDDRILELTVLNVFLKDFLIENIPLKVDEIRSWKKQKLWYNISTVYCSIFQISFRKMAHKM